ncbi:hypothetical protein ACHAWF_006048 [Thalassiosira exigua]
MMRSCLAAMASGAALINVGLELLVLGHELALLLAGRCGLGARAGAARELRREHGNLRGKGLLGLDLLLELGLEDGGIGLGGRAVALGGLALLLEVEALLVGTRGLLFVGWPPRSLRYPTLLGLLLCAFLSSRPHIVAPPLYRLRHRTFAPPPTVLESDAAVRGLWLLVCVVL